MFKKISNAARTATAAVTTTAAKVKRVVIGPAPVSKTTWASATVQGLLGAGYGAWLIPAFGPGLVVASGLAQFWLVSRLDQPGIAGASAKAARTAATVGYLAGPVVGSAVRSAGFVVPMAGRIAGRLVVATGVGHVHETIFREEMGKVLEDLVKEEEANE